MSIHAHDPAPSEDAALAFVESQGFGHLVAGGRDRDVPVVVPTEFVVASRSPVEVVLHLAGPNPVWDALGENPHVVLSVAGDWTYIPSAWKAIGDDSHRRAVAARLAERDGPGDGAARRRVLDSLA